MPIDILTAPPSSGLTLNVIGTGPDLVLVHGALGDYRQWQSIAEQLATRFRVIAISRRYHWPNPAPQAGTPYSYDTNVADLRTLLSEIGHPVHLAGHSYGAGVALLTALRDPGSLRSLTLMEPAVGSLLSGVTQPPGEQTSRESMVARVRELAKEGKDNEASETLIGWAQETAGGFAALSATAREHILENARTIGPTNSGPPPLVTADELQKMRIPTLIVRGENTRPWYRLVSDVIASNVPRARTATISKAGHMLIVENPNEAAESLRSFLADVR